MAASAVPKKKQVYQPGAEKAAHRETAGLS